MKEHVLLNFLPYTNNANLYLFNRNHTCSVMTLTIMILMATQMSTQDTKKAMERSLKVIFETE